MKETFNDQVLMDTFHNVGTGLTVFNDLGHYFLHLNIRVAAFYCTTTTNYV